MKDKRVDYSQFWSQAFDNMKDFVCFIDCDYNLVKANESFFKVFGGGEKDLIGKKCFEVFHSLKNPFPGCPHGKMLETKISKKGEFYEPSLKKHLSVTVTPIWGDDQKLIGSIHIAEDVTQLKEEGEKLKIRNDFIDKSMTPFAVVDPQGNILYVNASCLKLWGFVSDREVLGRPMFDFWKNQDQKKIAEIAEAYKNKEGWTGEITAKKNGGTMFDCHVVVNVVTDNSGRHLYITSSFTDITARKRAEEALRESEKSLRLVLEHINEALFIDDASGKLVYANDRFFETYGFKPEDLGSIKLEDYIAPEYRRQLRERHDRRFQGLSEPEHFEYKGQRPDGSCFWVEANVTAITDGQGKITNTQTIARDITERKKMEESLRETNAYLDNLFNYANAPIIVWDPQFKIARFNHAFESLTGLVAGEVLGQTLDLLFPPAQMQRTMEFIRKTSKGERWDTVEIEILHRDGTVRTVIWNSATLFDPDDKTPIATIAQGQDITKRKNAEDALRESDARYKALLDGAPEGVIVADIKTKQFRYVNPVMCKMFGYTEKEFVMFVNFNAIIPKNFN